MEVNPVLESTRNLIENPNFVFINHKKLIEIAKKFSQEKFIIPKWDFPEFPEGTYEDVIQSFMLGNSINFAFTDFTGKGKWETEYKGQKFKGSSGMWASLKRSKELGIPITEAEYLQGLPEKYAKIIFEGNFKIPMLKERTKILREIGKVLLEKYDGHFINLIESPNNRLFNNGNGLVEKLTRDFPSFNDSIIYGGEKIYFNKRAQLAPAVIYGRFQETKLCQFEDIDKLTVFSDYVLPKGLRDLGILEYSKTLAKKVDSGQEIYSGSLEELEIRASTIQAANKMIEIINQNRTDKINSLHLDGKIWKESRNPNGKPHHLTKTIYY